MRRDPNPLGIWMAGFLLHKTPAEARATAKQQHALSLQAGDLEGVAWWTQVLTFLTITGR